MMEKTPAHKHDVGYKKIFSNPKIVEELVASFVNESWVKDIDYTTLERIDKSFITEEFIERESDVIYRAHFKDKEVYIYLLLEFQSTIDRFMSLRMLRYICELYEHLVKTKGIKSLPVVFPIMLYNGDARWTAPEKLSDLIDKSISSEYIPEFRYYKISENELSKETLVKIKNFVSALFFAENSSRENLVEDLTVIRDMLRKENPETIDLFKNWLKNIFGAQKEIIEYIDNMQEEKTMLATTVKKYEEKLLQQGMQQGMQQGISATRSDVVKRMLSKDFPIEQIAELTGATVEEIQNIAKEK